MMKDMMSWMMGGMGLAWLLTIIVLVLLIAVFIKYLRKQASISDGAQLSSNRDVRANRESPR